MRSFLEELYADIKANAIEWKEDVDAAKAKDGPDDESLSMYACMLHMCRYVCMSVCMYVNYIFVGTVERKEKRTSEFKKEYFLIKQHALVRILLYMYVRTYVCMYYVCIYVYVCMYVCMYVCIGLLAD